MRHQICLSVMILFIFVPAGRADDKPAAPPFEFRGVWVATVSNIDWPSRKGLSTADQKTELLALLDKAAELKLNAVIFQVRPMCDALYASELEPWSEFLTGVLGQAPEPRYDPLELAVREAHARGLELHAWFNPYRAHQPSARSPIPDSHIVKRRPDLAKRYGRHYWLNPTHPDVQDHSLKVILDVVRRYDVDGVHLDDYFYPYAEKGADGKVIPFPDDDTWSDYQKSGGALSREDWRRDAVNRFVARMYRDVKALKPKVKVGISPFGIWRPGHPAGIEGLDAYAQLYADSRLWLQQGWVDYLTPQLYWPIAREKQSYPKLLAWWLAQNTQGRYVWPGLISGRVSGRGNGWPASEIIEQIKIAREQGAKGHILFSMKSLQRKGGIAEALKTTYAEPARVPPQPGLRGAVERALPLLQASATEYTRRRECFSCHHQALPLLALTTAQTRGFAVNESLLAEQVKFTREAMAKGRENFLKGRGIGGQVATAGYALWTLQLGGHAPDETTAAMTEYLLVRNQDRDYWPVNSQRPPSEASHFTTTYLALRGLGAFGTAEQRERAQQRTTAARDWLRKAEAVDTEDRVFRLWALQLAGATPAEVSTAARHLREAQRPDGGWSQTDDLASDAYATGSALVALHEAAGLSTEDSVYRRGLQFLLGAQQDDGSWHVASRSRPFQTYFESGFPHGKNQFISITASGWATTAMALACPTKK